MTATTQQVCEPASTKPAPRFCPNCKKRMRALPLPKPPVWRTVCDLSSAWLREGLTHTLPAVCKGVDYDHYTLGVLLELSPGRLRFVATDGRRLVLFDCPASKQFTRQTLLLRASGTRGWRRWLAQRDCPRWLRAESNGALLRLLAPGVSEQTAPALECQLLTSKFPNYEYVLRPPYFADWWFTANVADLCEALQKSLIDRNGKQMRRGHVTPVCLTTAYDKLCVEQESAAMPPIHLDPYLLLDSLRLLPRTSTVEVRGVDAMQPLIVTCAELPNWRLVVMPMRGPR